MKKLSKYLAVALILSCGMSPTSHVISGDVVTSTDVVFVGAGDIASDGSGDEVTAKLLDSIPGTVFTLGDNVYSSGTLEKFVEHYDPTWGRHKLRTKPSPGNHDYSDGEASGYFAYFGLLAGPAGRGYYSFDLGAWHIISLNSEIDVSAGSTQELWLRADLAANPTKCVLAYWHKARFSSGRHGSYPEYTALWQALYDYDADVILAGHDHNYQRFAPQTPNGAADPESGIRQFVVGTGGRSHYSLGRKTIPNTEAYNSKAYGVLKLTLSDSSYSWQFVPVAGQTFTDNGSSNCH